MSDEKEKQGLLKKLFGKKKSGCCSFEVEEIKNEAGEPSANKQKQWVDYYNQQRLHASIRCLRPVDYHFGNPDQLIEIRINGLTKARRNRKLENQRRINQENRSKQIPDKCLICA